MVEGMDPVAEAWVLGVTVGAEGSDASPIFAGPDAEDAGRMFFYGLRMALLRRARQLGGEFGFAGKSPLELRRLVNRGRFADLAVRTAFACWLEADE